MAKLWTDERVEFLKKHYPSKGVDYVSESLGLTKNQVYNKANKMKIKRELPWTKEQDQLLRDFYPMNGSKKASEVLGKSHTAVRSRIQKLGLKYIGATEEQKQFLIEHYPTKGAEYVAKHIDKSPDWVRSWASRNNINYINTNTWSKEEEDILRKYYPEGGVTKVLEMLPNRTKGAIFTRVSLLNIRTECFYWESWEEDFLKENYGKMPINNMAKILNRTYISIQYKAQRMSLKFLKPWTREEDEMLIENMNNMTMTALMDLFQRTRWNIYTRLVELGYTRNFYDEGYYSCREVADLIGVSTNTVNFRVKKGNQRPNTVKLEKSNRAVKRLSPADIIKFLYINKDLWIDKLDQVDKYEINTLCLDETVKLIAKKEMEFIKAAFNDTYWRGNASFRVGKEPDIV